MDAAEAERWDGVFAVVETTRTWYLGTVRVRDGALTVLTGLTGRPPVVPLDEVEEINDAERHPWVSFVDGA